MTAFAGAAPESIKWHTSTSLEHACFSRRFHQMCLKFDVDSLRILLNIHTCYVETEGRRLHYTNRKTLWDAPFRFSAGTKGQNGTPGREWLFSEVVPENLEEVPFRVENMSPFCRGFSFWPALSHVTRGVIEIGLLFRWPISFTNFRILQAWV